MNLEDNKIKTPMILGLLALTAIFVSGCIDDGDSVLEKKEVSIGYVLWDGEIASTNVLKQVYEAAGYDVEIIAVDAGPLYQGLARGNFDLTVSSWLPETQKNYWDIYRDQIDYVGPNLEGCRVGLVVPAYVGINSIEELNDLKADFGGKIVGIDPGAGIMQNTEDAIEMYDLDYNLEASSSAGMATALKRAIDREEWIVVTLWSPHWAFNRWDLKYLDDPLMAYGTGDNATTLARIGLEEEKPEAYAIAERFHWTQEDISEVMMDIENGIPEEQAAATWISNNPYKVKYWTEGHNQA
ncbi:glycine betaine ABC transporter substrate-binding protein [Candidatus Methanocrinis alkalitolerans]|uniref:glycine betaine ABC transporter substrate-binding protein n=1 Tax=Candidatus Methanocrinis alkalitolerans TaxID=3033395 RepID=UPI003743628E